MDSPSIDLGEYAIALRTARAALRPKKTQAQLAAEIGVPAHVITSLETGQRRYVYQKTADQARLIAKYLKFSVPYRGSDGSNGEQRLSAFDEEQQKLEAKWTETQSGNSKLNGSVYEPPALADPEIVAIDICNSALVKLPDTDSRENALDYLYNRWVRRVRRDTR